MMDTPDFTVVRTTRSSAEADMLIAVLRGAGFHPADLVTSAHFSLAGADTAFHIEVPTSEASEAGELLNSYDSPDPEASQNPPGESR